MRTASEKQKKQHQRNIEWQVRNRWKVTAAHLLIIGFMLLIISEKRLQLPHLLSCPPSLGIPIWHSVWLNIAELVAWVFVLVQFWVRIHNYRRDLLVAEQEALRKAATPPEGVWPPPPVS